MRDVQFQNNLMEGVDELMIDDKKLKIFWLTLMLNGTENEIKADTNVIQSKKTILAKIEENFQKEIDKLNAQKDNKTITTKEFNQRVEELLESKETLLKNIVL